MLMSVLLTNKLSTVPASANSGGFLCIMFVPTGITLRCWYSIVAPRMDYGLKGIELDAQPSRKQVMLSSNLSRNLNSGDSIVLLWSARNTTEGAIGVTYYALTSCVVRNN